MRWIKYIYSRYYWTAFSIIFTIFAFKIILGFAYHYTYRDVWPLHYQELKQEALTNLSYKNIVSEDNNQNIWWNPEAVYGATLDFREKFSSNKEIRTYLTKHFLDRGYHIKNKYVNSVKMANDQYIINFTEDSNKPGIWYCTVTYNKYLFLSW